MSTCKIAIMTFVRSIEPRYPDLDLYHPFYEQIRRLHDRGLPGTVLLEYDALQEDRYVDLLKTTSELDVGLWLEVVQPLTEAVGIPWRGTEPWDWHAYCGFLLGYTPEQRIQLINEAFSSFYARFGRYPTAVGSWMIDAFSLKYIEQTYAVKAAVICREQWGMDGYSLWGGYFSQGYYPSDRNVLCPAQTAGHQISVPVFRKSNSDPIYDYDFDLDYENHNQKYTPELIDIEPCTSSGADPMWLDWMLEINQAPHSTPFGYVDMGQENSFHWWRMEKGIELDYQRAAELRDAGEAELVTLTQLGEWYKQEFSHTAPCCLYADRDAEGLERGSLWYQGRYYRLNLYFDAQRMWIRDIHFFDEIYEERYLTEAEQSNGFVYDTLPVAEGRLWSDTAHRSGCYFCDPDGEPLRGLALPQIDNRGEAGVEVLWLVEGGELRISIQEEQLSIQFVGTTGFLKNTWIETENEAIPFVRVEDNVLYARHNGFEYTLHPEVGRVELYRGEWHLYADETGCIRLPFKSWP